MKLFLFALIIFISIKSNAQELKVNKVLGQEGQLLLIETSGKYEDIKVKVEDEDCAGSVRDKIGNYTVLKVIKKTINKDNSQKTVCEVISPVKIDSISLIPIRSPLESRGRFYLGGGLSFAKEAEVDSKANYDKSQINYALAYYNQKASLLIGGIYQVYSYRAWGSIPTGVGNNTKAYEYQYNNFLLGLTTRKLYGDLEKNPTYIRGDLGLSWNTIGTSLIASPFDKSLGTGIGANLGVGVLIKAGGGNIDLGLFQSFRTSSESSEVGNMTNLALGYMF